MRRILKTSLVGAAAAALFRSPGMSRRPRSTGRRHRSCSPATGRTAITSARRSRSPAMWPSSAPRRRTLGLRVPFRRRAVGRGAEARRERRGGGDRFGTSVALSGAVALVGAPGAGVSGSPTCTVSTACSGRGAEAHRQRRAAGDAFAVRSRFRAPWLSSAHVNQGRLRRRNSEPGPRLGLRVPFRRRAVGRGAEARRERRAQGDELGASVAVSGDVALVGAPQPGWLPNDIRPGPGSAYVYRFDGGHWIESRSSSRGTGLSGTSSARRWRSR